MGILDAFNKDDRVEIKVCELLTYFKNEAKTDARNEIMLNGLRAGMPHEVILIMLGEEVPENEAAKWQRVVEMPALKLSGEAVAEKMDALTPVIVKEPGKEDVTAKEPRKLIKFFCMDCGKINFALVWRENGVYHMECRECKQTYDFREADLTKAEYDCQECGKHNYYFTPEIENMGVSKDRCKCGNETQLFYSVTTESYISVVGE